MENKDTVQNNRAKTAVFDLVMTAMFSALIAVFSLISIPVGAVPVTLQTLAVCFAAGMLGLKRGIISVVIYILLGAIGLPVFAGMTGGFGVIAGPLGGYIVGFILTAAVVGFSADRWGRRLLPLALSMAVGILLCYAIGTAWFMTVTGRGFAESLMMCVVPFLLPDAVKLALAALLVNRLYPVIKIPKG